MTTAQAILATLAYHDIFNYPLAQTEIHRYMIGEKISLPSLQKALAGLTDSKKVQKTGDYYHLRRRSNITAVRKRRRVYSNSKYKKALLFKKILSTIPFIKLIAITGALSMDNSARDDDIDLLIISQRDKLWTTRFVANILLAPLRRSPNSPNSADRACLNMFIDESALGLKDKNLYTAHELAQLKPIYNKDKTYSKLIKSNLWLYDYLPNWQPMEVES